MVWSMIAGGISAAVSAVSTVVSTIGPTVANFCVNVLPRIAPYIEKGIEVLRVVGNIAQAVLQAFAIFKPGETTEEMGDRALQAKDEGITPEGFDSFDDYLARVREQKLDPVKSASFSEVEKVTAGLAIGAAALDKRFNVGDGVMGNLWVLAAASPGFFNAERLTSILGKTTDIGSVIRYFDGKLDLEQAVGVEKKLMEAEKGLSPEKTDKTIIQELNEAGKAMRNPPA